MSLSHPAVKKQRSLIYSIERGVGVVIPPRSSFYQLIINPCFLLSFTQQLLLVAQLYVPFLFFLFYQFFVNVHEGCRCGCPTHIVFLSCLIINPCSPSFTLRLSPFTNTGLTWISINCEFQGKL